MSDREWGYEALQRGDIQAALPLLERACQQDPNDYQSHLFLGAAYGQAERANDAVTVLTRAVEIEPANAQARYNLGIALERAGWPNEAMTALQQALTLQADYPKAQEALQRMQGSALPQQPVLPLPSASAQPVQTATPEPGLANYNPTSQPTVYGQPSQQPGYTQPTTYGSSAQPTVYGQSQPHGIPASGYVIQQPGSAPANPYGAPPPAMPYGNPYAATHAAENTSGMKGPVPTKSKACAGTGARFTSTGYGFAPTTWSLPASACSSVNSSSAS